MKALVEYKERKEKEEEILRMQGGYEVASMPLKRQRSSVATSMVTPSAMMPNEIADS